MNTETDANPSENTRCSTSPSAPGKFWRLLCVSRNPGGNWLATQADGGGRAAATTGTGALRYQRSLAVGTDGWKALSGMSATRLSSLNEVSSIT